MSLFRRKVGKEAPASRPSDHGDFELKRPSAIPTPPDVADSRAEAYVDRFLSSLNRHDMESALDATQEIFITTPETFNSPRGTVLERSWHWLSNIASDGEKRAEYARSAKVALFCQIWNRMILAQDSMLQFGRLVPAPLDVEMEIYRSGLRSLIRLPADLELVPRVGDEGWSVSEALDQISHCVTLMNEEGLNVPIELQRLAAADPDTIASLRPEPQLTIEDDHFEGVIDRLSSNAKDAAQGDLASIAYMQGGAIILEQGDPQKALEKFEEAARLGHVDAMSSAGSQYLELGNLAGARFWWEAAAKGGKADAAWNLAATSYESGDQASAITWYRAAAELGDSRGYAALTQIASDSGDREAEFENARRGAEAGDPFCLVYFGELLALGSEGQTPEPRRALGYLEKAAQGGDTDAMVSAGITRLKLGQLHEAKQWLLQADRAGNQRARIILDQYFN